jgi:hypothetical protein
MTVCWPYVTCDGLSPGVKMFSYARLWRESGWTFAFRSVSIIGANVTRWWRRHLDRLVDTMPLGRIHPWLASS